MKILQLAQKPQRRGAEVFAVQLGRWLAAAGHRVRHAYLYRYDGDEPLDLGSGDVAFDRHQDTLLERLPWGNPALLIGLRRLVGRFRPDVVQANGGRSVKYAALLALTSPRRRWKLVYRNIDSPLFWVRGLARTVYFRHLVMPRVDGVVGVSRKTLEEVYDFYRLSVPGRFIPNGIDLAALDDAADRRLVREGLGVAQEQVVVLFFGALTAQKRPRRFLHLIRRLRDGGEDVVGWLLGDGEMRGELESLAGELDLRPAVRFLGFQSRVADYLAAADVCASTSDSEGIPAAVLEAGYLGVPTVGYDVGGMRECIRHGATGSLAPAGDAAEHFRLVRHLVRDAEARRRLGGAARRFVEEEFSMHSVGRGYESFYEQLVGAAGGGR